MRVQDKMPQGLKGLARMNKVIHGHWQSKHYQKKGIAFYLEDGRLVEGALDADTVYYGMEIEVAYTAFSGNVVGQGSTLSGFDDALENTFEVEVDGSIQDRSGRHCGFEIVVAPMTIDALIHFLSTPDMRAMLKDSTDKGNNGIHIHVSKTSKWSKKIEDNYIALMTVLGPQLENLTRSTGYAKWYHNEFNLGNDAIATMTSEASHASRAIRNDRYYCLNLENDHTIEFRFFNFTNDMERIQKYLNLLESLNRLARSHGTTVSVVREYTAVNLHVKKSNWKIDVGYVD